MMSFAVLLLCAVSGHTVKLNKTVDVVCDRQMEESMQRNIERLEKLQSDTLAQIGNVETLFAEMSLNMTRDISEIKEELYRVQTICSPPCENGGQCVKNVCNCTPSFTGNRCQKAVCTPPCENRGHCMKNNVCNCTSLYTGNRCQNVLCRPPCENGGQCMTNNTCQCTLFSTGDRCQQAVCSPPCANGGKCMRDNVCKCMSSFYGDRCQDGPKCGVDFDNSDINEGGNKSNSIVWPWMAVVFKNKTSRTEHVCDGSVIHRHFVLTSAGCVNVQGSDGLSVKLGLSDLKKRTHLQEYQVRSVHAHPQYNNRHSNDYNIALLEVENPITFGPFVRPVCLPPREIPQDEQFYKPQSTAKAVYMDSYIQFPRNESPRMLNLTIISQRECRRRLKVVGWDKVFPSPDLSFCAVKRSPACSRPGAPLMQSSLTGNGTQTWTQVGHRSGCDGTYFYSLRLDNLMAWVETTIAAAASKR